MEITSIRKTPNLFGPTTGQYPVGATNLLIHGYHTSDKDALDAYEEIEFNLDRLCFGLLWPGRELFLEFPLAVNNATEAGWRLKDILWDVSFLTELTIQTHSLGFRVACEALNYDLKIHRLIGSAPAVNKDAFDSEFKNVLSNVSRIDIAYSSNDPVLRDNYPFGSFMHTAMGLHGAATKAPNLFNHDFSSLVHSHSGYKDCQEYYDLWLLRNGSWN